MKKGLIIALAMVMAVCIGIGATLAYLFVETTPVVNTFSYGDINIELKEHKYVNGKLTNEEVTANNSYKVIPGVTEDKDPFVRIKSDSEKCYVYVTVQNLVKLDNGTVVASIDINTNNWKEVGTNGDTTLYRYKDIVDASADAKDIELQVFTKVTYDAEKILKDNIAQVNNDTIRVVAYAYQATNVAQIDADTAVRNMAGIPLI